MDDTAEELAFINEELLSDPNNKDLLELKAGLEELLAATDAAEPVIETQNTKITKPPPGPIDLFAGCGNTTVNPAVYANAILQNKKDEFRIEFTTAGIFQPEALQQRKRRPLLLQPKLKHSSIAEWEDHTRGIGSKLLKQMGYVEGLGIGKTKKGIAEPLALDKQTGNTGWGLGHERRNRLETKSKKRRRAKQERSTESSNRHSGDVLGFINDQISNDKSENALHAHSRKRVKTISLRGMDRDSMSKIVQQTEFAITALETKLRKLRHSRQRNSKDRTMVSMLDKKIKIAEEELSTQRTTVQTLNIKLGLKNSHKKRKSKIF